MRSFWFTLGPMLLAAALVLWGGERLARRTVEERIPADRDRLFDFTASLRQELDRLNSLHTAHLTEVATAIFSLTPKQIESRCANLIGIHSLTTFVSGKTDSGRSWKKSLSPAPSVIAEGKFGRLDSRNAIILPKELLEAQSAGSGWLVGPEPGYRVRWIRLQPAQVVAFVVDDTELGQALKSHLDSWLAAPLSPLRDAGELVALQGPGGEEWLAFPADMRVGPAAMILPHRTGLGEWQVLAWDRLKIRETHDSASLILACGIAGTLVLTGIFLKIQHSRVLFLAEQRVSFANRVSHELGSPLTNILLNLDLASRALESRPAETQHRLSLVNEEIQRLSRLVLNVLTFSRGENKTLKLTTDSVIPDQVVENVLSQFQPSLERRKVLIEWQRAATSDAKLDPDALAQIVGNLISNVEKYASAGGWLGIDTSMRNERLTIRVSDRGPGIPSRFRERIFGAYERIHAGVNEGSSGTGLGLSIARDLARRMNGDLILIPTTDGACFELELPATHP